MTKKEAAAETEKKAEKSLDELILNYTLSKYNAVPLAAVWAKELRRREENRHLTINEILELALSDVLGGKVDFKDIRKLAASSALAEANGEEAEKSKK